MRETDLLKMQKEAFDDLLAYKKEHPEFRFSIRQNNNKGRLEKGYIFQGNEDYFAIPLYSVGNRATKTKTIHYEVTKEGDRYIAIVFNSIIGETEKDLEFHEALVDFLKAREEVRLEYEKERRFYFRFKERDLKKSLYFYIDTFRRRADALLEEYNLKERYLIAEDKFEKNIRRVEKIRKQIGEKMVGETKKRKSNRIKNIILYGVPGVGKTHNIAKLIRLIEEGKSDNEIFSMIQNNEKSNEELPDDLKERTAFVTFHQSFGYEDFIEGFRPNEEGKIELVDGVFKRLCNEASKNISKSTKSDKLVFDDAFDKLLKEKIENSDTVRIDLARDNSFYEIYDYNERSIYYTRQGRSKEDRYHTLSIKTLKSMYEQETVDVISGGLKTYYKPLLEKLLETGRREKTETVERKNYYLVIDEINRGNISKIFGELITLIEEDKRDRLEVTLPYSKEPFSVPSNLYIIGTMNSTDKSIALIDVALRRRFTFLKMEPKAELIENDKARAVFEELNKFLKERLDEDHQIGQSYFMKIQDDEDLKFVLEYKIKPLLEEYFYGDKEGLKEALDIASLKELKGVEAE